MRQAIALVALIAVGTTAVPLVGLAIYQAYSLEQSKRAIATDFIVRDVTERLASFEVEISNLAAAPAFATAVMDSIGRAQHLRPLLAQRATALHASFDLLDHRGRLLLAVAPDGTATEPPMISSQPGTMLPLQVESRIRGRELNVGAPIHFAADQRVIGALVGSVDLAAVVQAAFSRVQADYEIRAALDGAELLSTHTSFVPGKHAEAIPLPHTGPKPPTLTVALQPRLTWMDTYAERLGVVALSAIGISLMMTVVAGRRLSRSVVQPVSELVDAAAQYKQGYLPEMPKAGRVTELAELAQAIGSAFAARERAQLEAVRATEEMLQGLPVVVFRGWLDEEGNYRLDYVGANAARILGTSIEAGAQPSDWLSWLDAGAAAEARATRLRALSDPQTSLVYALRDGTGKTSWLQERVRLLTRSPDGEALMVGTVTDITDERILQAQAANAAKLAMLGEMATGVAHELNQPSAAITLAADIAVMELERGGPEDLRSLHRRMGQIAQQACRMRDIIDHFRIFARNDDAAGGDADLIEVVNGALTIAGGAMNTAGVKVTTAVPPGLPRVSGRAVPLEQVLVNLLVNARDAMEAVPPGGRAVEITAEPDVERRRTTLTVRDHGPGVPDDILDRVFDPFFTSKPVGKGTGLGLSISYGTIRGYGGNIRIENQTDGGAAVIMELPWAALPEL
jgi:signal transduction histidine kinase